MATDHHDSDSPAGHGTHPLRPDDTPPRNRVIFSYTMLGVITLVGLKFVFDSYLDSSRRDVRRDHIEASHTQVVLDAYRAEQRLRLSGGPMPIDRAIQEIGRRGRTAFPQLRPMPSEDREPLIGWAQLPRETGAAEAAPALEEGAIPSAEGALPQGTLEDESAPLPPPGTTPPETERPGGGGVGDHPSERAPDGPAPGEGVPEARAPREATAPAQTARPIRPRADVAAGGADSAEAQGEGATGGAAAREEAMRGTAPRPATPRTAAPREAAPQQPTPEPAPTE
jgi:hypothetical protein